MNNKVLLRSIAVVTTLGLASCFAKGDTYYIDPDFTGSPQNGSLSNPYSAWSQVSCTADNSYLQKRGTTATASAQILPRANNIIGAYGTGDRPIINSTTTGGSKAFDMGYGAGSTIQDIEIAAPNALCCIGMTNSSCVNITIDNCILHDSSWGVRMTGGANTITILNTEIYDTKDDGVYAQYCDDLEIGYCSIHDVNLNFYLISPDQRDSGGDCIQVDTGDNFYFHHNLIDHSSTGNKFCIIVATGDGGIIEYNHLIGQMPNEGGGMYLNGETNLTVRSNVVENAGIGIYAPYVTSGFLVYNNIVNHNGVGIYMSGSYPAEVYNNTFYDTGSAINRTWGTSAALTCENNIFGVPLETDLMYQISSTISPATNFVSNYNLVYSEKTGFIIEGSSYNTLAAWTTAKGRDGNSISGDPLFVDADEADFSLSQGSPAIGAGVYISDDISGPAPVDIGADVTTLASTGISVDGAESLAPQYVLTPNTDPAEGEMVGCWHMDEGSGTTIEDESGYDSFGTISGATWTTGKWGSGLSFSKANSDFVLLDNTEGNLFIGPTSFTLAAWINPASLPSSSETRGIIGGPASLALYGASNILIFMKTTLATAPSSNYSVPISTWTHVAVTFDSTATTNNLKYYVNGSCVNTVTFNYNLPGQDVLLGVATFRTNYYDGVIDEVSIFNRVLTAAEVAALTNQGPTVEITDPVEDDEFDAGDDITITVSASDSDGTIAKVEFYQGETKLGEDTTSPYTYTWTSVAAGEYSLTAKATDDDNKSTISTAVNITVVNNVIATNANVPDTMDAGGTSSDHAIYQFTGYTATRSVTQTVGSTTSYNELQVINGSAITLSGYNNFYVGGDSTSDYDSLLVDSSSTLTLGNYLYVGYGSDYNDVTIDGTASGTRIYVGGNTTAYGDDNSLVVDGGSVTVQRVYTGSGSTTSTNNTVLVAGGGTLTNTGQDFVIGMTSSTGVNSFTISDVGSRLIYSGGSNDLGWFKILGTDNYIRVENGGVLQVVSTSTAKTLSQTSTGKVQMNSGYIAMIGDRTATNNVGTVYIWNGSAYVLGTKDTDGTLAAGEYSVTYCATVADVQAVMGSDYTSAMSALAGYTITTDCSGE